MTRSPVLRTAAALAGYAAFVLLVQDGGAAALDRAWAVVLAVAAAVGQAIGWVVAAILGTVRDPQRLIDLTLTAVTVILGLLGAAGVLLAWGAVGTRERTPDPVTTEGPVITEGAEIVRLPDRRQPTPQRDAA